MAETEDGKKVFSLLEVTTSIQKTLAQRYTTSFWVKAEMNKLNYYPHSGHCYPDLVEKIDGKVIAQLKATLWKDDFNRINKNFLSVVKAPLKDGIKMLFCARITFDPVHGLALRITEIDPVFSLGELEREKQHCIALLQKEGIFSKNKSLPFPLLPQRLAIISVQTSKGYADFNKMIGANSWGYKFVHVLFPSLLQGDRAVDSIRVQLQQIRKVAKHFDVVAIIRGGGGEVGLSCFNDYNLSRDIALFPLPVITGIGHATNETVAEMVAFRNAITPTELADFLLQKFHNFSVPVHNAQEFLVGKVRRMMAEERQRMFQTVKYFRSVTDNVLARSHHEIQRSARDLSKVSGLSIMQKKQMHGSLIYKLRGFSLSAVRQGGQELKQMIFALRKDISSFVRQQHGDIINVDKTISNMDPANVLKRGYTITRVNGKAIMRHDEVRPGDVIQTIMHDGMIYSDAKSIKKSSEL